MSFPHFLKLEKVEPNFCSTFSKSGKSGKSGNKIDCFIESNHLPI